MNKKFWAPTQSCFIYKQVNAQHIDVTRKNWLLKVSYVPATSVASSKGFSKAFFLRPLTVLMRPTRQVVRAINQSIFLRCLWPRLRHSIQKKSYGAWESFFLCCQILHKNNNVFGKVIVEFQYNICKLNFYGTNTRIKIK